MLQSIILEDESPESTCSCGMRNHEREESESECKTECGGQRTPNLEYCGGNFRDNVFKILPRPQAFTLAGDV